MNALVNLTIIVSLLTVFLFVLADKWKIFNWYEYHRPAWAPPADCLFCLSFWTAVLVTVGLLLTGLLAPSFSVLLLPLLSAALSSVLISIVLTP